MVVGTGALADAALPPPYTGEVFLGRLVGWVKSFQPIVLVPLVLLAIGWTVATARRERVRSESFGTISAALLLPFLGVLAEQHPIFLHRLDLPRPHADQDAALDERVRIGGKVKPVGLEVVLNL